MISAANGINDLRSPAKLLGVSPFLYFGIPGELWLVAWSVVLILLPGRTLMTALRDRHASSIVIA
jgi:hypothetical protein